jgi:hypothetical protein
MDPLTLTILIITSTAVSAIGSIATIFRKNIKKMSCCFGGIDFRTVTDSPLSSQKNIDIPLKEMVKPPQILKSDTYYTETYENAYEQATQQTQNIDIPKPDHWLK